MLLFSLSCWALLFNGVGLQDDCEQYTWYEINLDKNWNGPP